MVDQVVSGEPILTAWGNSVADAINAGPAGQLGYAEVPADQPVTGFGAWRT